VTVGSGTRLLAHGVRTTFPTTVPDSASRRASAARASGSRAAIRALTFWTRLHGTLYLELAGHFHGMDIDPALYYAAELDELTGPAGHDAM
jgi:hypothetical protein